MKNKQSALWTHKKMKSVFIALGMISTASYAQVVQNTTDPVDTLTESDAAVVRVTQKINEKATNQYSKSLFSHENQLVSKLRVDPPPATDNSFTISTDPNKPDPIWGDGKNLNFKDCKWKHPPISIQSQSVCAEKNFSDKNICTGITSCTLNGFWFGMPVIIDGVEQSATCRELPDGTCPSPGKCHDEKFVKNSVVAFKDGNGALVNGTKAAEKDTADQVKTNAHLAH